MQVRRVKKERLNMMASHQFSRDIPNRCTKGFIPKQTSEGSSTIRGAASIPIALQSYVFAVPRRGIESVMYMCHNDLVFQSSEKLIR